MMQSNTVWGSKEGGSKKDDKSDTRGHVSRTDNRIWFYDEVNQSSVVGLVRSMREIASDLVEEQSRLELPSLRPIHLHIHSYGGELFAGLAAADAIRALQVPVHTHIEGGAASAATLISVMGAHRTIGKFSFIMIHQLSSIFWGKYEEWKDEMRNNDLLMAAVLRIYDGRTKLKKKSIAEVLKRDLWYPAEKALKAGLVDEVV